MARGRMIDKRVSNSKKLGKVSDKGARLYFMIYPHLDKKGRIAFDDLHDLKIEIIPTLVNWGMKKIISSLNELADVGLIQLYPNNDRIAIQIVRFEDFQTIRDDREAASKIPPLEVAPGNSGVFRITPALSLSLMNEGREEKKKTLPLLMFNFSTEKWEGIQEKNKERWKKTYPAVDLEQELLRMADWLIANPKKAKSNYNAFISNWLRRTQDRGGSLPSNKFRKNPLEGWTPKTDDEGGEPF